MNEVQSWLVSFGINDYWVGAMDADGADEIQWIETGEHVGQSFWMTGEPNHMQGDCAVLDVNNGLKLNDCASALNALCILYS